MAFTRDNIPSHESPVEAPVKMPIWKGFPFACSASAIFAISEVGRSCGCETAEADVVAMFDKAGSFCCRNGFECHNYSIIFVLGIIISIFSIQNFGPDNGFSGFFSRMNSKFRVVGRSRFYFLRNCFVLFYFHFLRSGLGV